MQLPGRKEGTSATAKHGLMCQLVMSHGLVCAERASQRGCLTSFLQRASRLAWLSCSRMLLLRSSSSSCSVADSRMDRSSRSDTAPRS